MSDQQSFPELGIYTLPGKVDDPQRCLDEIRLAEELGLGSVWVGERYDYKNAEVICGAAAAITSRINIATGLVNYPTHHPMELCSFGATMAGLSGNRFAMGIGRGFDALYSCFGTPNATLKGLEDITMILRTVWEQGSYSGENAVGNYPYLFIHKPLPTSPPLMLGALGPKALALAGRCYDGVILHPCLTDAAIARQSQLVKASAEQAGRDPSTVKVYATAVCAADQSEEETSAIGPARLLTYLHHEGYGEHVCKANGWDPEILKKMRAHKLFEDGRSADQDFTRYETAEVCAMFPDHWISETMALGTAEHCANRLNDNFAAGADGIIIHGSLPNQVNALLQAYAKVRVGERFEACNPWPKQD